MSGRPYVSLFHTESGAHSLLTAAAGGRIFSFVEPDRLAELVCSLPQELLELARARERLSQTDPGGHATGDFAGVIEGLAKTHL
jgi:hypothetical protein